MAKNFEEIQAKLSQYIQSRFTEIVNKQNKVEECFTKNPTNIARYTDCTKSLMNKFKTSEETIGIGMQFLGAKLEECIQKNPNLEGCFEESKGYIDDLVKLVEKDFR